MEFSLDSGQGKPNLHLVMKVPPTFSYTYNAYYIYAFDIYSQDGFDLSSGILHVICFRNQSMISLPKS